MWILIRLLITVATFALHFVLRWVRDKPEGELAGRPFYKTIRRNKQKRITGFSIGIALSAPIVFRLQAEAASDRLFKKLGFAEEFQTGDSDFDQRVYIASDHPALHRLLIENERLRVLVRRALDMGFRCVSGDGTVLWLDRSADREPLAAELRLLADLGMAMAASGRAWKVFSIPSPPRSRSSRRWCGRSSLMASPALFPRSGT
ncbi:MAG: hypothetical protein HC897_07360 [Thermoanaerobaculia bacterium]|nr:hypothetical protein [Thermoanaerobaculia bacterium]